MELQAPYHLFGNVRGNSYVRVDPVTGLVTFKGLARPYLGLWIPLTAMEPTSAPDYDATNFGYLFPNNSTTEFLTANIALDHDYAPGTSLYPRILWHQAAATPPAWKISYRWLNPGEQVGAFTTATATGQEYTYIQGTILQTSYFPTIPGAGKKMGSILQVKLYRDDAVLAGDALAIAFGVFKKVDSLGSQTLTLKSVPGAQVSSSPSASASASPSASPSASAS